MAAPDEAPPLDAHHHGSVLVGHGAPDEDRPTVGVPSRRLSVENLYRAGQPVARADRLEPADLLHPGRAPAVGSAEQAVDPHACPRGARVPSAGDESPEGRVFGRLGVDVEVLRVETAAEVDDLGLGHLIGAEVDHLPGREVLEEQRRFGPAEATGRGLNHPVCLPAGRCGAPLRLSDCATGSFER